MAKPLLDAVCSWCNDMFSIDDLDTWPYKTETGGGREALFCDEDCKTCHDMTLEQKLP